MVPCLRIFAVRFLFTSGAGIQAGANLAARCLVDTECFDDAYLEGATRVVEKNRNSSVISVGPTIRIRIGKQYRNYNSYWILVNAACYPVAEQMRAAVKARFKVDLATQPYHGGNLKLDTYA